MEDHWLARIGILHKMIVLASLVAHAPHSLNEQEKTPQVLVPSSLDSDFMLKPFELCQDVQSKESPLFEEESADRACSVRNFKTKMPGFKLGSQAAYS